MLYVNGPVQNGDFTFAARPGKAVGIHLAEVLNKLLGVAPAPHLWNTVMVEGDRRYRRQVEEVGRSLTRREFELDLIDSKYEPSAQTAAVLTDTDPAVAALAVALIERQLSVGQLAIECHVVPSCAACGHMSLMTSQPCHACGHPTHVRRSKRLLVAHRTSDRPALEPRRIHAKQRRSPRHLRDIAANLPQMLILSRTRGHGIDLGTFGLPGQVLDPRVGIHLAALAAARAADSDTVVMTISANAAANVAGYGSVFLDHDDPRLLYTLHGRMPYESIESLEPIYDRYDLDEAARATFSSVFLPLWAWKEKTGTPATQLPPLLKHYRRSFLLAEGEPSTDAQLARIRDDVRAGQPEWIGDKALLGEALRRIIA